MRIKLVLISLMIKQISAHSIELERPCAATLIIKYLVECPVIAVHIYYMFSQIFQVCRLDYYGEVGHAAHHLLFTDHPEREHRGARPVAAGVCVCVCGGGGGVGLRHAERTRI